MGMLRALPLVSAIIILILYNPLFAEETTSPFSQSKFVPDISLIADFSGTWRNMNDDRFKTLESPGLTHSAAEKEEHGHPHGESNAHRGFNFNYGELVISSPVDPYFDLMAVFHLSESGFEAEEAYFTTRMLPFGFQIKGGKFLSGFGRINEQHAHSWDFSDRPSVHAAFFGNEGLNEKGLRLTWIAPVDFYLMIGGEWLEGENEESFGTEGFHGPAGEDSYNIRGSNGPGLYCGYFKTSFDAGDFSFLLGASLARGDTRINHKFDETGVEGMAVHASTLIAGGEITVRYTIDSYRSVSFQGEYLYRSMKGDLYTHDATDLVDKRELDKRQSGLYTQAVVRLSRLFRIGARYDLVINNALSVNGENEETVPRYLPRCSGMCDLTLTEFSRIRIQYNHDRSKFLAEDGEHHRVVNHEVTIQCNMAIGSHGAHRF